MMDKSTVWIPCLSASFVYRLTNIYFLFQDLTVQLAVKEKELEVASAKADNVLREVTVKAQAAEKVKSQVQVVKDRAQVIVDGIGVSSCSGNVRNIPYACWETYCHRNIYSTQTSSWLLLLEKRLRRAIMRLSYNGLMYSSCLVK